MRKKNKGIYQFILDLEREKNRERALREKARRENFLRPTEQLVTPQSANDEQESNLRAMPHVEIGNRTIEPLKAKIFEFKRKGPHLETELEISTVLAAFSFISIIVLLQIDALMRQNLYSYRHQVLNGIIPYWMAVNTALGIFWLMVIAAILFKMYVFAHKRR